MVQAEGVVVVDSGTGAPEFAVEAVGHIPPPVGGVEAQTQAKAQLGPTGGYCQ